MLLGEVAYDALGMGKISLAALLPYRIRRRENRIVIEETLKDFGLEDADIKAVDKGARDCTIRARVTAAAVRATGKDVWA